MTKKQEKQYLEHILDHMNSDETGFITGSILPWVCWSFFFGAFTLLLLFHEQLGPSILLILGSTAGVLLGAVSFWRLCALKWPYIRHHLNRSSIERRLREIES